MQVLVTGATGFIGSTLAACFLARGFQVTCLSRGTGFVERTRGKIQDAARGFELDVDVDRVRVLPYDLHRLGARELCSVDAVWHCAAHMAFSPKALRDAIDVNVGATRLLYERLAAHARSARFFYVSTAFTGGVEAGVIDEELHLSPHLINPYFASKWAAELVPERLTREAGAPSVVIYRPTAVIGHTQTGWYGGPSYGFYNFMEGVCVARVAGGRSMRVDMAPEVQHCYLPIEDLAHNAVVLTTALPAGPCARSLGRREQAVQSLGARREALSIPLLADGSLAGRGVPAS